jgi:hypothetical protein
MTKEAGGVVKAKWRDGVMAVFAGGRKKRI